MTCHVPKQITFLKIFDELLHVALVDFCNNLRKLYTTSQCVQFNTRVA